MSHRTLIAGTAREVTGGKTLIAGTGREISGGKTLIGGTGYEISFDDGFVLFKAGDTSLRNGATGVLRSYRHYTVGTTTIVSNALVDDVYGDGDGRYSAQYTTGGLYFQRVRNSDPSAVDYVDFLCGVISISCSDFANYANMLVECDGDLWVTISNRSQRMSNVSGVVTIPLSSSGTVVIGTNNSSGMFPHTVTKIWLE